jgi:hypothetical protein
VRSPSTGFDRKADHLVAAEPDRFRRHEIVGHQDDVAFDVGDLVVGYPLQHSQKLTPDVLEILPAFPQVGVLDRREPLGELPRRLVHGPFGVDLLLEDPALDLIEEHAVGKQEGVSVENGREFLTE